jgi:archaellum biogenesis ATPase FlaH
MEMEALANSRTYLDIVVLDSLQMAVSGNTLETVQKHLAPCRAIVSVAVSG